MKTIEDLPDLVGEPVSAISFVMDYIEVHFNGSIVRALTNPRIYSPEKSLVFPEIGSRDLLCELITKELIEVQIEEEVVIRLIFQQGYCLEIPLSAPNGLDAAHFLPYYAGPLQVWD